MAETGHAKNVSNFQTLITFCTGYGADYNPTNAMIELTALTTALGNRKPSRKGSEGLPQFKTR